MHALLLAATLLTYRGTVVVRHRSGAEEPLPAAVVSIWPETAYRRDAKVAVTATDGTFAIDDMAPGLYSFDIIATHDRIGGLIRIGPEPESRKFLFFDPTCWALYGKVFDQSTGSPIAGALVTYLGRGVSDDDGNYFIDWGCSTATFRFHNTFFYYVEARGYEGIALMGGRGEYVQGSGVLDFDLTPAPEPRPPQTRQR